jgi:hypothetical protein
MKTVLTAEKAKKFAGENKVFKLKTWCFSGAAGLDYTKFS